MNPLSTLQVRQLANHRLALDQIENSIAILKKTLEQLAVDKCSTVVSFECFNDSQYQNNNAQQEKDMMLDQPDFFGCIPRRRYPDPRTQLIACLTETPAIRVINALLLEFQRESDILKNKLQHLILPIQNNIVSSNPIQQLHENNP